MVQKQVDIYILKDLIKQILRAYLELMHVSVFVFSRSLMSAFQVSIGTVGTRDVS